MGRYSTGAETCEASMRIELSYLIKKKYFVKGTVRTGKLIWTCGDRETGNIKIIGSWQEEIYLRLIYKLTERHSQQEYKYDYKIQLTTVPSNLGKGEVLYFLCPVTGKRCRVLYSAYGYHKWKSREAYQNRLYYKTQVASKMGYANDRYWSLEDKVKKTYLRKYFKETYNGEPTRRRKYLDKLYEKLDYWDLKRWSPESMPKFILRL